MTIQKLEDVTLAQGDIIEMIFEFENSDKTIPDFSDYRCLFILSQYGYEDENVLQIEGFLKMDTTNSFTVILNSDDTLKLDAGTYTMKVVITNGTIFIKKARGILNILKDTNEIKI